MDHRQIVIHWQRAVIYVKGFPAVQLVSTGHGLPGSESRGWICVQEEDIPATTNFYYGSPPNIHNVDTTYWPYGSMVKMRFIAYEPLSWMSKADILWYSRITTRDAGWSQQPIAATTFPLSTTFLYRCNSLSRVNHLYCGNPLIAPFSNLPNCIEP